MGRGSVFISMVFIYVYEVYALPDPVGKPAHTVVDSLPGKHSNESYNSYSLMQKWRKALISVLANNLLLVIHLRLLTNW